MFIFTVADASFFPLPTSTFFLVLALMNTRKAFTYMIYAVLGTVIGALAGYFIGRLAWLKPDGEFTGLVKFLTSNIPGYSEVVYNRFHILYAKWDFWILFIASLTPLPYGIFSISSGIFDINIFIFFFATIISQGIRFLFLAMVTIKLGPGVKRLFVLNWKPIAIISSVFIIIAVVVFKAF